MLNTLNIIGKTFEELAALFFCNVANDDDFYDVLAYNLATEYPKQLQVMLEGLSGSRLRSAICALGWTETTEHDAIIRGYLLHVDPLVVAAAIDALRDIGAMDWSTVAHTLNHSSAYVRGAALRFAKASLGADALPVLREALHDSDAIVRQNVLDELDGLVCVDDLPWIEPYLTDPSVAVRQAAAGVVGAIT